MMSNITFFPIIELSYSDSQDIIGHFEQSLTCKNESVTHENESGVAKSNLFWFLRRHVYFVDSHVLADGMVPPWTIITVTS